MSNLAWVAFLWLHLDRIPASIADQLPIQVESLVLVASIPVVGALIASRHPRHPVGWLLLIASFAFAVVTSRMGLARKRSLGIAEGRGDGLLRIRLINLGINPLKPGDVFSRVWLQIWPAVSLILPSRSTAVYST